MSRRERPAVTNAIALYVFDERTLRALDQHDDGVRLFQDIIAIFRQRDVDRLRTSALIDSLSAIEGRPWTGMSSEYLCDSQKLARLLRPLHIRPKTIRFVDGTAKGYERRWFEQALRRLPPRDGALG